MQTVPLVEAGNECVFDINGRYAPIAFTRAHLVFPQQGWVWRDVSNLQPIASRVLPHDDHHQQM